MKIKDLTAAYRLHYLEHDDRAGYEAVAPELFAHYYANWADISKPLLTLSKSELLDRSQTIHYSLSRIEPALERFGIEIEPLELVLMVGQDTSNGHAYLVENCFHPWVAVECYLSRPLADIFVTHEIVHAEHYRRNPAFYFENRSEKDNSLRQLLTEGIATWLTSEILGISKALALWADYWTEERIANWLKQCHDNLPRLARHLLEQIDAEKCSQLFVLAEPDNILANRSGYYLGLQGVQAIAYENGLAPIEVLALPRFEAENLILDWMHRQTD